MTVPERTPRRDDDESGFTLIELLVVIIIIGILAAIAIPVYLNQRVKAYDSAAKSDLNQLAKFEEIYLESHASYGTIADLIGDGLEIGPSRGNTLWVVRYNGEFSYCLKAKNSASPRFWFYDSAGGGMQPQGAADCSTTTSGAPGGTITR